MTDKTPGFVLDKPLCTRCGLCVEDCPINVLELDSSGFPAVKAERADGCVSCQHCLAICQQGAVTVGGVGPADTQPLRPELLPKFEQMDHLVRARRSIRRYRDIDVEPALIARLLDALENAPTGVNARDLTFTMIDQRSVMSALRERVMDSIAAALESGASPQRADFLAGVVKAWRTRGRDVVFRTAPHMLVVSCPPTTPTAQQDVPLTLAYFELLAQSAGLGTVWCGYFRLLCEALPALKALVSLKEDAVYYAMLFGYPAVKYARTVQRAGSARIHRVASIG